MQVSDSGHGVDSIKITVDQCGGLIGHVRTLHKFALNATEPNEKACFATAGILMAAAAAEALLSEFAFKFRPDLYAERDFRKANPSDKYMKLVGVKSKDLADLWEARKAIQHSEPDNERSRMVGAVLNPEGVDWALKAVCAATREVFAHHQEPMPDYLEQAVRGD